MPIGRPTWIALSLVAIVLAAGAAAQSPAALADRQAELNARYQRLENRMLELARILREKEPDKAERLRDGLAMSGRNQLKSRLAELRQLLAESRFGAADREQERLVGDLEAMLEFLLNPNDELDRLRREREALEELRRGVRRLFDEQTRQLYETRRVGEPSGPLEPPPAPAPGEPRPSGDDEAQAEARQAALRELEDRQRDLQRRAGEIGGEMSPGDPASGTPPTPGRESFEQAQRSMQRAADRLGEHAPQQSQTEQETALHAMQEALDDLERALRQLREEERAEALMQLESRLRSILADERSVRGMAAVLLETSADARDRAWDLKRGEALELHRAAILETEQTHRIMVAEGTTVVAPALLELIIGDMARATAALEAAPPSVEALPALDDVIALLEELLAAIEQERDQMEQSDDTGGQPPGDSDRARPLLPRSAELKLLRSQQLRVNDQTRAAADEADDATTLARLAERQAWLSRRARQINEALE